ncbi:MAG: hypothetical protein Q8O84_01275 [Nanoarchaeota archaeon]|nr:hypothetical protein [Nanoarchaeota archaeon]
MEEPTHDGIKQVEKPVYNFEEFVPKQEPKKVEIVKVHEKVKLSPIQKRILKKVRELEVEKERLEEKLNN